MNELYGRSEAKWLEEIFPVPVQEDERVEHSLQTWCAQALNASLTEQLLQIGLPGDRACIHCVVQEQPAESGKRVLKPCISP